MAAENKANFVVNLVGNVAQKARAFGSDIAAMGDKGSRSMRLFSAATNQTNRVLDVFDNKIVGFATGGSAVMMMRKVGNWQQQLTELSTQFNLTGDEIEQFNNRIWSAADARKLPYEQVTDAVTKMLERTNDAGAVTNNLDNIALAIKGIGLSADDAGQKIGILSSKGYSPSQIHELLNDAANASTFGTGNISEQFNRVVDMATATNWNNPEQLKQLLAIERLGDSTFGNSSQSTAAMQSFYNALLDRSKQNILRQNGVEVFSNLKTGELRDPMDIFLEMANATGFKKDNIESISGGDLVELMKSFQSNDRQKQLKESFKDAQANLIDDKANRNIATFNSALTSLTNAGEKWAQLKLAKPIQDLADAINSLTPEQLDEYASKLETSVKIIGGAVAARYLYRGRQQLTGMFNQQTSTTGGALTQAAAGDVVRVYVTNWNENGQSQDVGAQSDGKKGLSLQDHARQVGRGNVDKQVYITANVVSLLSKEINSDELKENSPELDKRFKDIIAMQENPEQYVADNYSDGNAPTWMSYLFGAGGDNSLQNAFAKYSEASLAQSQAMASMYGSGEIVLKVESDSGLTVKTQSVTAKDIDLTVDTGSTRGLY